PISGYTVVADNATLYITKLDGTTFTPTFSNAAADDQHIYSSAIGTVHLDFAQQVQLVSSGPADDPIDNGDHWTVTVADTLGVDHDSEIITAGSTTMGQVTTQLGNDIAGKNATYIVTKDIVNNIITITT